MIRKLIRRLRGRDPHIPQLPAQWGRVDVTVRPEELTYEQTAALLHISYWTSDGPANVDGGDEPGEEVVRELRDELQRMWAEERTVSINRTELPSGTCRPALRHVAYGNVREMLTFFPDEDIQVHLRT